MQQASIHSGSADGGSGDQAQDKEKLYQLVAELSREETREAALLELSKKREAFPDLAPILWHSFGTTATLLQEIVCIYPLLSPPQLTAHASNRVCNALALLQCVASHPETRTLFLKAHIPLFLYPFLNTISKTRPFEYLRLTSLGVIGALVKMDDSDVRSPPVRILFIIVMIKWIRTSRLSIKNSLSASSRAERESGMDDSVVRSSSSTSLLSL